MADETGAVEAPEDAQPEAAQEQVENRPAGGSQTYTKEELDAHTDAVVKRRIDKQRKAHEEELAARDAELAALREAKEAQDARLAELEAADARRRAVDEAAEATGLAAAQIALLSGNTAEELQEAARAFMAAAPRGYPVIPGDGGDPEPPTVTREEVMAIKDRRERIRAIAEHPELF